MKSLFGLLISYLLPLVTVDYSLWWTGPLVLRVITPAIRRITKIYHYNVDVSSTKPQGIHSAAGAPAPFVQRARAMQLRNSTLVWYSHCRSVGQVLS